MLSLARPKSNALVRPKSARAGLSKRTKKANVLARPRSVRTAGREGTRGDRGGQ